MKLFLTIFALLASSVIFCQTKYEKDFKTFCNTVDDQYAYFDQQQISWSKVKALYQPQVKQVTNDNEFIVFLETVLNEFHNGHISLNRNLSTSNRIIPSGQDMFVEKKKEKFILTDLRKGFGAELAGLKIGDEIVRFNEQTIATQLEKFLPKYTTILSKEMYQYAVNMLFAGTHDTERIITVKRNGKEVNCFPDRSSKTASKERIESKILNKTTAYVKINNSLGDLKTISDFDEAIDRFLGYPHLVIDLTETPGGGNTTVARSILGRFVHKIMPYQQHEYDEKEYQTKRWWVEYVTPRKTQYKGKVFVIVGHWTGSMGEGMAIGFDGLKGTKIIGTEMAKLLGAIDGFTLPETNISFQIPTERLYHINGTPREKYKPILLTRNIDETLRKINEIK